MAPCLKVQPTKREDLSSIPRSHRVEGDSYEQRRLSLPHQLLHTYTYGQSINLISEGKRGAGAVAHTFNPGTQEA